jgi:HEAT repeat protein
MSGIRWAILLSGTWAWAAGCGLFGAQKKVEPPPPAPSQQAQTPAAYQQSQPSDWGSRVGTADPRFDDSALGESGYASHADQIGAGQIDQLKMGGPSSAPKIALFLADPGPAVRAKAVEALSGFGQQAESALPKVLELLRDTKPEIRLAAAQALAGIGSAKIREQAALSLKDPSPAVQAWIHAALVRSGEPCEPHQVAAASILRANLGQTPAQVVGAMVWMQCASHEAIELLVAACSSQDENQRAAAARALGQIGAPAASAVPQLIGLLGDKKAFRARLAALLALAHMGSKSLPALPLLVDALTDPAPKFRELAAHALGSIGPAAKDAIGPLTQATRDTEGTVQMAAKKALARIASDAKGE